MKYFIIFLFLIGSASVSHAEESISSNDTKNNYDEPTCPSGTVLKDRLCVVVDPNVPPFNQRDCIIATASFGSEMAPQVQMLREIRDKIVLKTYSGGLFMNGFNTIYYLFSPSIAELENENPLFKEMVKIFITPMITTLSIMTFAEIRKNASGQYLYSTDESKIWKASDTYWTITSKKGSDQTPADTPVRFMGIVSGERSGTVVTVNAQVLGGTYGTLNGQTLATFTGQSGDSGAPVFSPGTTNVSFYGILVGNYKIGSTTYGVYSPWQHIKSELNLTP